MGQDTFLIWSISKSCWHSLFKKIFLIYFWLHWAFIAAHRLSLLEVSGGDSLVVVPRLLIVVASFVAEHGHQGVGALLAPPLGCGSGPRGDPGRLGPS